MSTTEMMAEPDWLAEIPSARAKLTAIMAAVSRCYAECPLGSPDDQTGPHITTTMAELFIGQLLMAAEDRVPADERFVVLERPEPRDILVIGPHGEEAVTVEPGGNRENPGVFLGADLIRLHGDEPLRVALALVDAMAESEATP